MVQRFGRACTGFLVVSGSKLYFLHLALLGGPGVVACLAFGAALESWRWADVVLEEADIETCGIADPAWGGLPD